MKTRTRADLSQVTDSDLVARLKASVEASAPSSSVERPAESLNREETPQLKPTEAEILEAILPALGEWRTSIQLQRVAHVDAAPLRQVLATLIERGDLETKGQKKGKRYRLSGIGHD